MSESRRHRWNEFLLPRVDLCLCLCLSLSLSLCLNTHVHAHTHTHTHTRVLSLCCRQFTDFGMAGSLRWSCMVKGLASPFLCLIVSNSTNAMSNSSSWSAQDQSLPVILNCLISHLIFTMTLRINFVNEETSS